MTMPRLFALVLFLVLGFLVFGAAALAQPGPGGSPGTPGPAPTQSVPIDGGLGLLALAGGAYAVPRLRQR